MKRVIRSVTAAILSTAVLTCAAAAPVVTVLTEAGIVAQAYDAEISVGENSYIICAVDQSTGQASLIHYEGSEANINIPGAVQGCPITSVAAGAFRGNTVLKSIGFSNAVRIEDNAFVGCTNLMTVGGNVTYVGNSAFKGCTNLRNFNFSNQLSFIGNYAFQGCGLNTVTLTGTKLTSLSTGAFADCARLTNVTVSNAKVGSSAFENCVALQSASLNDVPEIGARAFYQCEKLSGIKLPAVLRYIGESAFEGCISLMDVMIPAGVSVIYPCTFRNCTSMSNAVFSEGLTDIGAYAFTNCPNLSVPGFPSTLKSIGISAFQGCRGITSFTAPAGMTEIADSVFSDCINLKNVLLSPAVKAIGNYSFSYCTSLASVTIPENSVTYIGSGAFYGCAALKNLVLPVSVQGMGDNAYADCTQLAYLTLSSSCNFDESSSSVPIYYHEEMANNSTVTVNGVSTNSLTLGGTAVITGQAAYPNEGYAAASCTYTYYWKKASADVWNALGTGASVNFAPSAADTYNLRIIATDGVGRTRSRDYNLIVHYPQLVNASTVSGESISLGDSIQLNAVASGGSGSYTYAFKYMPDGSSYTTISGTQEYGTANTAVFRPAEKGNYKLMVQVKDSTGTVKSKTFTLNVTSNETEKLLNRSTISSGTVTAGTKITITGNASGGKAPYTYTYQYKKAAASSWTNIGKKYTSVTTASFKPGSAVPYVVRVIVKDSTGKTVKKDFDLNVTGSTALSNQSTVTISSKTYDNSKTLTAAVGTKITLNAQAAGGSGGYTYALMYKKSGSSTWTKIGKKYGTASSGSFTPKSKTTYDIMINVKDSSGTVKSKTFTLKLT